MPQLLKGGKYVFAWTRVSASGRIVIPPEAAAEYRLLDSQRLIVLPGSRTSGGLAVGSLVTLQRSALGSVLAALPDLVSCRIPEAATIVHRGKPYCWVRLLDGAFLLPRATLARYGLDSGVLLLVVRGSGLAVGFAVRGRIVEEAKKHPDLEVF